MTADCEVGVSSLELFFDLVFVFAITQIATLIHHDMTPTGLLRGLRVLSDLRDAQL